MTLTTELAQRMREAAEKTTALNLDTAELERGPEGCIDCPCCNGDGYVEEERDFCNIDGFALGVQFYGVGEHHGLAEEYFRLANPANVLALLDALETKDKQITRMSAFQSELSAELANCNGIIFEQAKERRELRQRIAELEAAASQKFMPVGVMSRSRWDSLENGDTRFIALWPRPAVPVRRKRPDDGILVYAKITEEHP